jgi:crossover junction endodeoxyribonuclease RuvC
MSGSGGLLALDLATALGWALGRISARPLTQLEAAVQKPRQPMSGVFRIAPVGTAVGPFLAAYETWLSAMIAQHAPAGIIFEAPILPKKTTPATVRKLVGLSGMTEKVAHQRGITWVREAQPSTVKLHICGNGGPGKAGVQNAIRARGWTFATDDEADALAVHDYGAHLFARERLAA